MKVSTFDLNDFEKAADPLLVGEVMSVLSAMPLYVKKSDQAGKQGRLIFDPVGANAHLEKKLIRRKWASKVPIPKAQQALGTDVDFGKSGHLVEVQFSNYPFFLNNVNRTNVLFANKTELDGMGRIVAAIIVTKAKLFEASNSTLYYEQAMEQTRFLVGGKTVAVPLRVIGLMADRGTTISSILTHYHTPRYSRTVVHQDRIQVQVGDEDSHLERPLLKQV